MSQVAEPARTDVLLWPGMRSEYSWIPGGEGPTQTGAYQVGVSFSAHRRAVYRAANRVIEADIADGAVFVTGEDPITWLRIRETTEALEIYPDPGLLRSLAGGEPRLELAAAARDGTVLAISSVLKRAHTGGAVLTDMAASTLAHRLAGHLLAHYGNPRHGRARGSPGLLSSKVVDHVAEFVEVGLSGTLTLDGLARVASLSPFHFARAFKATTGMTPHQFVTARRMHRATRLLAASNLPVTEVGAAVGIANPSYFRRLFRRHMGVLPGQLRQNSKIGPCAARRLMPVSEHGSDRLLDRPRGRRDRL